MQGRNFGILQLLLMSSFWTWKKHIESKFWFNYMLMGYRSLQLSNNNSTTVVVRQTKELHFLMGKFFYTFFITSYLMYPWNATLHRFCCAAATVDENTTRKKAANREERKKNHKKLAFERRKKKALSCSAMECKLMHGAMVNEGNQKSTRERDWRNNITTLPTSTINRAQAIWIGNS